MASEETLETRISNLEQIVGIIPNNKEDLGARLDALERFVNTELAGTVSNIVYQSVDEEGNISSTEKYKIVDPDAVNRVRAYVDAFLKENITEQLTAEIKKDIKAVKKYVGFENGEDTNLTKQLSNIIEEVYRNSSETDSSSRLDYMEEDIERIARVLNEEAGIEIKLAEYEGDLFSRLKAFENNIKSIIEVLHFFGYDISSTGVGFTFPKNAEYISTDEKGRLQARSSSKEVLVGDYGLITSDAIASELREYFKNGDYARLGVSDIHEIIEWNDELWASSNWLITNGNTQFYKDFFVDTNGQNALFKAYSKNEPTEWPIEVNENTIIYIPITYSGILTLQCFYGNFKILTYGGKYISFDKAPGDNNFAAKFNFVETEIISDTRYIKIYCTAKDYIKGIKYEYENDFCLTTLKDKIVTTVPIMDADGNELVSKLRYAKVTKAEIGLERVNNTYDYEKPISTLQQKAFDEEEKNRKEADEALQKNLDEEIKKRTEINKELEERLSNEVAIINEHFERKEIKREEDDNKLQENINKEAQERTNNDNKLQENINKEAQERTNNDSKLQENINKEAQERTNNDNKLQENINKEAQERSQNIAAANKRIDDISSHLPDAKDDVNYILATKNNLKDAIASVIDKAPEKFDTLKEIADWILNDEEVDANAAKRILTLENEAKRLIEFDDYLHNLIMEEVDNREKAANANVKKLNETINTKEIELYNALSKNNEELLKNREELDNIIKTNYDSLFEKTDDVYNELSKTINENYNILNKGMSILNSAILDDIETTRNDINNRIDVLKHKNTDITYDEENKTTSITNGLKVPDIAKQETALTTRVLGLSNDGTLIPAYIKTKLINHKVNLLDKENDNKIIATFYFDSMEERSYTSASSIPRLAAANTLSYTLDDSSICIGHQVIKDGDYFIITSIKSNDTSTKIEFVTDKYHCNSLNIDDIVYPNIQTGYTYKDVEDEPFKEEIQSQTTGIEE